MGLEKHPVLVSKKLSGLGLGLGLEACGLDYNTGMYYSSSLTATLHFLLSHHAVKAFDLDQSSFSCECDVASGSSITLNGWARIKQQPCQALVHSEQTPNPIWMAVCGTGCYNMVCGLFLCTTFTGRSGSHAPFMH